MNSSVLSPSCSASVKDDNEDGDEEDVLSLRPVIDDGGTKATTFVVCDKHAADKIRKEAKE
jgi:hypothetical protein